MANWGYKLIRKLGFRLGGVNHSLEFRYTNIPSRGSLLLVDDITKEVVINDSAFGIHWHFPNLYNVWKYEEKKDE
ncbi:hypothetical protein DRN34_00095 [Thermococci archaeon]|nr:MAG: hypothetical protein DRN34_00095 [Thermococci archaeon]